MRLPVATAAFAGSWVANVQIVALGTEACRQSWRSHCGMVRGGAAKKVRSTYGCDRIAQSTADRTEEAFHAPFCRRGPSSTGYGDSCRDYGVFEPIDRMRMPRG